MRTILSFTRWFCSQLTGDELLEAISILLGVRPHGALKRKPPVPLPELESIDTLQGRWLKLLELAA